MKKLFLLLIGILVLILWFYFIDPRQTWEGIKNVDLSYLVMGYIVYFISHGLKILRWGLIVNKIKKVPLGKIFSYYWAALFISNFMPLRIGEISKSIFLKKDFDVSISASVSTIVVDRLYGVIIRLIVICFIPFFSIDLYSYLKNYLIYITLFSLILLIFLSLLLINHRWFAEIINNIFFFLPKSLNQRIASFLKDSATDIKRINLQKSDIFVFVLLSVLGLLAQALLVDLFFRAVGIQLPVSLYIITTTVMDFLAMLPSPPASIGTTEWYTNIVYTIGLGISKNTVASITLITHGLNLLFVAVLGLASLVSTGHSFFSKLSYKSESLSS